MKSIPVKRLESGFAMPVFGLGTWMLGGDAEHDPANDDAADIKAIAQALDAGITHIDMAELYAAGHAESLVGKAIADRDRAELFLVSKVARGNQQPDQVRKSLEGSLSRIGTDYLDLYLLHAPSRDVPIEETMPVMDALVDEGLVKAIGVSNFSISQMERAQAASGHKLVVNQLHYNVQVREVEHKGILKYCQTHDMLLTAFRPLESGALVASNELVESLCNKYDKTPAQIALNWLISQDAVTAISKVADAQHLVENLGALDWTMSDEDIELIRRDYPDQEAVSPRFELTE